MDSGSRNEKAVNQYFPPLMQTAPIAIYEIENPSSPKFKRVNDAVVNLLGCSREELLSANPFDFLTPESRTKFKQRMVQAQAGKKIDQNVEYEVLTKGGEVKSVTLSIQPILKDGKVFGALVIAYDITELKNAEAELAETKGRLQGILDTMNDGLISISLDGKVIDCNETTLKQLGLAKEEVIGKNVTDFILPEDRGRSMAEIQPEVRAAGKGLTQVRVMRKDGSFFFAEISVTAMYDKNRKPTGMFGVARDITDRKKAEEALKTSGERLYNIINAMDDGIVLIGLDGKVIDCNQATLVQFKMKREEVIGKVIMDFMVSENKENFIRETQETLRKTGIARVETQLARKNGSPLPVEVSLTRFCDKDKKPIGLLGVARDISERKQLQQELENYTKDLEKMVEERTRQLQDKERLATIGQTAGMVGHDIRNPLQAVLSDIYLLKDDLASMPEGENKEGAVESIDSIEKNVDYINKIVQDLQDYARPIVPEYSIADLSDVFVQVFETVSVPQSINLSINVKDAEKIRTDPALLQRAIANLVNNAIQAMPDGGKLEIWGGTIDGRIVVTVSDTGGGIPDEIKPKLFTPLMTTKAKGQGLGLAVVKRLVEALNGSIAFESEIGKGTIFTICLPK